MLKYTVFFLFFIIVLGNVFSLGKKEKTNSPEISLVTGVETVDTGSSGSRPDAAGEDTKKIIGRIQIYGNEPHTFVGIVGGDGTEYAVYSPSHEGELRRLQGYLIEFTVVFLEEPQGYGSLFLKGGTVTPVSWEIIQ